jgi:fucose permease
MGYFSAFCLQAVISIITIIALPMWKKAHPETEILTKTEETTHLSLFTQAKMPAIRATWLMFVASCAIEATCTQWGSSFLVESKNASPDIAALIVILYFSGLASARFLSGLLAKKLTSWKLIYLGCGFLTLAILLLALPIPHVAAPCIGLFLTGFGVGPVYPNLTYLTPINFDKEHSQAVIGSQMALAYVGILFAPIIFGFLAQAISTAVFPYYIAAEFGLFLFAMFRLVSILKKQNKYEIQELDK